MSHLKLEIVSPGHADSELARHLDFTFERLEADGAVVRLPPSRAALDAPGSGRVDDRALIATADHCMGVAVHAALADKGPLATVDLKFEKFRPLEPGDVFLRVGRASIDSRLAFVAASLDQGVPERPVGHVSARFIVGAWPGGGAMPFPPPIPHEKRDDDVVDFASFAGLPVKAAPSLILAPLERTIGARAVPAFHGGVVAAGLMSSAGALAASERGEAAVMANCSVDYLRAAHATRPIRYASEIVSSGRTTLRIRTSAYQDVDDRLVTQALVLFGCGLS